MHGHPLPVPGVPQAQGEGEGEGEAVTRQSVALDAIALLWCHLRKDDQGAQAILADTEDVAELASFIAAGFVLEMGDRYGQVEADEILAASRHVALHHWWPE